MEAMSNSTIAPGRYHTTFLDDRIAGWCVLVVSILGLGPYTLCILLILLSREMRLMPFYHYLLSLGVSDCSTLLGWVILGIHMITNGLVLPYYLSVVGVHLISLGWETGSIHMLIISFHRYCSISNWKLEKKFFKQKVKPWMYLAGIWVFAALHQIIVMRGSFWNMDGHDMNIPFANTEYGFLYYIWDLGKNFIVLSVSISCYISIIRTQRASARRVGAHKKAGNKGNSHEDKQQKEKQAAQIRLAVQTGIVFGIFADADLSYWIAIFAGGSKWVLYFFTDFSWALSCTSNPVVYFAFNKMIAKEWKTRTQPISRIFSKSSSSNATGTTSANGASSTANSSKPK